MDQLSILKMKMLLKKKQIQAATPLAEHPKEEIKIKESTLPPESDMNLPRNISLPIPVQNVQKQLPPNSSEEKSVKIPVVVGEEQKNKKINEMKMKLLQRMKDLKKISSSSIQSAQVHQEVAALAQPQITDKRQANDEPQILEATANSEIKELVQSSFMNNKVNQVKNDTIEKSNMKQVRQIFIQNEKDEQNNFQVKGSIEQKIVQIQQGRQNTEQISIQVQFRQNQQKIDNQNKKINIVNDNQQDTFNQEQKEQKDQQDNKDMQVNLEEQVNNDDKEQNSEQKDNYNAAVIQEQLNIDNHIDSDQDDEQIEEPQQNNQKDQQVNHSIHQIQPNLQPNYQINQDQQNKSENQQEDQQQIANQAQDNDNLVEEEEQKQKLSIMQSKIQKKKSKIFLKQLDQVVTLSRKIKIVLQQRYGQLIEKGSSTVASIKDTVNKLKLVFKI